MGRRVAASFGIRLRGASGPGKPLSRAARAGKGKGVVRREDLPAEVFAGASAA